MEFIPTLVLTITVFYSIIIVLRKAENKFFNNIKYSQSDIHNVFKKTNFVKKETAKKQTQLSKRVDKNSVTVVILDNKAYWVNDNIFYSADFVDDNVKTETSRPIDIDDLSKEDVNKMLIS